MNFTQRIFLTALVLTLRSTYKLIISNNRYNSFLTIIGSTGDNSYGLTANHKRSCNTTHSLLLFGILFGPMLFHE